MASYAEMESECTSVAIVQVMGSTGWLCWCFAHRTCGQGALPTPAAPSPLGAWVTHFLGPGAARYMCNAPVCNSGIFMTTAQNIRARPASQYSAIRDALAV